MRLLKWLLLALAGLGVATLVAAQFGLLRGTAPTGLGARNGRLEPPSNNPNSVSSQADLWPDHPQRTYARIAPLALLQGDGPATIARLKALAQAVPGAQLVTARDDYLYLQFSSRVLKFVDDTEFWFDPVAKVVQVRSASRLGRKDFGVNRARIESLRQQLAAGR